MSFFAHHYYNRIVRKAARTWIVTRHTWQKDLRHTASAEKHFISIAAIIEEVRSAIHPLLPTRRDESTGNLLVLYAL